MGSGGGRSRGSTREQERLQREQLQLERERLALEQQAQQALTRDTSLLQQQLSEQQKVADEQTRLIQQLNQESAQQQAEFSSLLQEQTAESARNRELSEVERVRAASNNARQLQRANFSLLRTLDYSR